MAQVVTDTRCSVTLAELWRDHTINDLILYLEAMSFADDRERPAG
jgi:hypothetical protein